MVTTVARALPRPARSTASLIAGVVLLVVLALPLASNPPGGAEASLPPQIGRIDSAAETADTGSSSTDQEVGPYLGSQTVALGPVASGCDQRPMLRDLPDVVPPCALRLAVWDQPWWPLPLPSQDRVPPQVEAEGLPPTRAPPLTAHATLRPSRSVPSTAPSASTSDLRVLVPAQGRP